MAYKASLLFYDLNDKMVEEVKFIEMTMEEIHLELRKRGFLPMIDDESTESESNEEYY